MIKRKNKRGALTDILLWVIVSIITLVLLGFFVYIFATVETKLSAIGVVGDINFTEITAQTFGVANQSVAATMHIVAFIILALGGFSILLHNFLIKAHPAFIVTYVMMTVGGVIASAYVSNAYADLLTNALLGSTLQGFTAANFIMTWLPLWTTVIGIFGFIFLFINVTRDGSGGTI